jgi:DNA-directed RNA polymerase subunit beta'
LLDAQNAAVAYTTNHKGTMGDMVRSGGRGSAGQLMKIVAAPVLARDEKEKIVPWFLNRSYAEGLKPADAWVAGNEARINAIKSNISVVEPGDLAKILINNMGDKLVTVADCGTTNGIAMKADDAHIIDRYLAKPLTNPAVQANTLISPALARQIAATNDVVVVRSPMTCLAHDGVCQKCQGLDYTGKLHSVGVNVGMRAAQAMSEPLTQFSLNAKHGGRIDKGGDTKQLEGIKGVRQLLEIPESFLHKATLAEHAGEVGKVEAAPQGGNYVWVDQTRHYVAPAMKVVAKTGQKVEAGDVLSEGVPKPDEIVRYKGLGQGRQYLVDVMHDVYKRAGANVDKRHLETLAKSVLNHVYIADVGKDDHGFLKGDIVNYNRYVDALANSRKNVDIKDAIGETLAGNVLHFTAGTPVTQTMHDEMAKRGIAKVNIAHDAPRIEPVMRPASRTPLLNPSWLQRLAHRYLKDSLLSGAHRGDVSDTHSYNPAAAYAEGTAFGQGEDGKY